MWKKHLNRLEKLKFYTYSLPVISLFNERIITHYITFERQNASGSSNTKYKFVTLKIKLWEASKVDLFFRQIYDLKKIFCKNHLTHCFET